MNFFHFGSFAYCERKILLFQSLVLTFLFWQVWMLLWLRALIIMRDCGPGKAGELMLAEWWDHYMKSMLNLKMRLQGLIVSQVFFSFLFPFFFSFWLPETSKHTAGLHNFPRNSKRIHKLRIICSWCACLTVRGNADSCHWPVRRFLPSLEQEAPFLWDPSLLSLFAKAIMRQCPSLHTTQNCTICDLWTSTLHHTPFKHLQSVAELWWHLLFPMGLDLLATATIIGTCIKNYSLAGMIRFGRPGTAGAPGCLKRILY